MSELCLLHNISRKTGYILLKRFQEQGETALLARSHRPIHHPNTLPESVADAVREVRRNHPTWGPKKIRAWLQQNSSLTTIPATSTIGTLLDQAGLVVHRRKKRRIPVVRPTITSHYAAPNSTWCVDFKGQFRLGDGTFCYPLTLTDGYSRYILRCQALPSTSVELARPVFEAAFREFGLPETILSDNGTPFASTGIGGLTELSLWWASLGIRLERILPGRPDQNGRHERMHKTMKAETTHPPEAGIRLQQQRFDRWRREFNEERPHEALNQETPCSVYVPSYRLYPCPPVQQILGEGEELRRVSRNRIFLQRQITLGTVINDQMIRIGPVVNERRKLWFHHVFLGEVDITTHSLVSPVEPSAALDNTGADGVAPLNEEGGHSLDNPLGGCPQPLGQPLRGLPLLPNAIRTSNVH